MLSINKFKTSISNEMKEIIASLILLFLFEIASFGQVTSDTAFFNNKWKNRQVLIMNIIEL